MFLHRKFHPSACNVYTSTQEKWSNELLIRLFKNSSDPCGLIKHHVGAIMMEIAYGIKVQEKDDPWIKLCEEVVEIFSRVTQPGAFLVNMIPFGE
jgi:tRNA G10  N-methylase Trm11